MTKRSVNIGLCGLGTVGQGVIELLAEGGDVLRTRVGADIALRHCATRTPKPEINTLGATESRDVFAVAQDPEVDVLVELIGGTTVAKDLVVAALEQGKHVVTANKALLAEHGETLFALAEAKGLTLRFEAAVAGGIPIIETVKSSLATNHVTSVAGIINGTGNFILTEMAAKGREFADVLEEAQALGYAEADPTFDVDGTDAAQKLVLLASLAFGQRIDVASVFKQGVDSVSPTDIDYARELGFCIKHLGIAKRQGSAIELRVHPTLIPKSKAIAQVDGVLNAVMINASGVGELLLVGPGAGSRPTASAVTADIAAIALSIAKGDQPSALNMGIPLAYFSTASIVDIDHVSSSWYLRLEAEDTPGAMAAITQCLSERDIGIASLIQKLDSPDVQRVPVVLLTDNASTAAIASAMKSIEALPSVGGQVTSLRVEYF